MKHLLFATKSYSISILRPLSRAIQRDGESVCWYLGPELNPDLLLEADDLLLSTIDDVREFSPDVVYAPGNYIPHFIPGVKVHVFHGMSAPQYGKKGHFRIRGFFDLYCTHGPRDTEQFNSLQLKYPHFRVVETGWPKLDPLFDSVKGATKVEGNGGMKTILFAPTFSPSLSSASDLFPVFQKIADEGLYRLVFKFHPKMSKSVCDLYSGLISSYVRMCGSHEDIFPLMANSDLMISDNSSVVLEYLFLKKPLITYRNLSPESFFNNVDSPGLLIDRIHDVLNEHQSVSDAQAEFVLNLHPYFDGKSSERVIRAVREFVHVGCHGLKKKPTNFLRRIKTRMLMRYYKL